MASRLHSVLAHKNRSTNVFLATAMLGFLIVGCNQTPANTANTNVSSSAAPSFVAASNEYEDGTYTAMGNYTSPAGAEQVGVTVTLEDDVITNAVFDSKATHPTSMKMQGQFGAGFETEVVGKSIDEVNLTVVNGSSLAPKGFMDALAKIKAEAQA